MNSPPFGIENLNNSIHSLRDTFTLLSFVYVILYGNENNTFHTPVLRNIPQHTHTHTQYYEGWTKQENVKPYFAKNFNHLEQKFKIFTARILKIEQSLQYFMLLMVYFKISYSQISRNNRLMPQGSLQKIIYQNNTVFGGKRCPF